MPGDKLRRPRSLEVRKVKVISRKVFELLTVWAPPSDVSSSGSKEGKKSCSG